MSENKLSYSDDALLNRIFLSNTKSKYIICVEDCNKEYEYEIILCRLLDISMEEDILDIFPMNGKNGLVKAYQIYGEKNSGRYVIYIADGDFDVMLDKEMVQSPNFIYLERYNIESYFIDKSAVVAYMMGKLKCISRVAFKKIDFETWEMDTYDKFRELFLLFVIAQKIIPQEETIGKKPYVFLSENGMVDKGKIDKYRNELYVRIGINECKNLYNEFEEKFIDKLNGEPKRLICGKYLLASLACYLRRKLDVNFKEEEFRNYLIKTFDINSMRFIKERIGRLT